MKHTISLALVLTLGACSSETTEPAAVAYEGYPYHSNFIELPGGETEPPVLAW